MIAKGNIMTKHGCTVKRLREAFKEHTVLTLPMVSDALGKPCRMTLFRKLKQLDYRSSYSHRGMYYVLSEDAEYDKNGLWMFGDIRFSLYGTLSETLTDLVRKSRDGRFAGELRPIVQVAVQETLALLNRGGVLVREPFGVQYLYVFPSRAGEQRRCRRSQVGAYAVEPPANREAWKEFSSAMQTLLPMLNEKQRRLYLGLESIRLGRGGDGRVALVAGVNVKTVAKGRGELLRHAGGTEAIRAAGAGRPAFKKKAN